MAVQQGQLAPTDTTKNLSNYYNDAVVSSVSDVDRGIHNGTQYVRLVLQRPQAVDAHSGATGSPDTLTAASHYIDGAFTANPTSGVNLVRVGFASGQQVSTTSVTLYSTQPINTTVGNWDIATSFDGTDSQFSNANFKATGLSIAETPVVLDGVSQFKYVVSFTAPSIGGLRYWRVKHTTAGSFNDLTEVEIVEPLTPTITYFDTDGSLASSYPFENTSPAAPDILDAAYDNINDVFYTIRFNSDTTGTTTVTLSDDFSEDDAGTASGTNNFNSARWIESSSNTAFLRAGGVLSYNTAAGKGQLETTYNLVDFTAAIDVNPISVSAENEWFVMRALDSSSNVVVQEGVSIETSPTSSGVYFAAAVENFVDATANSDLRELRPLWHNAASGTESFTITYSGSVWTVTGTVAGLLTDASTGVLYNESVDANTPIEFIISSTATPSEGEQFTFDVTTENVKKEPTATGVIGISRTTSDFTTSQVFTTARTIPPAYGPVTIELFGSTVGSVNVSADNFAVPGSGIFSNVAVFTVERTDSEGDLVTGNPYVIESFDVIGDSSLGYNDFLDGKVQIAATASGSGGGFIYIKINNTLYKYSNAVSLGSEDGSSALESTIGQIATEGTHSLSWTHESGIGGLPFLTYIEYDDVLDIIHLRTMDKDTLLDTTDTKEVLLDISGYSDSQEFRVFYDQNDFDTLYYVDASTNLQSFNIDDRISAFMAVNAEDVTLPAGTAQQTYVNADVINAWGEALSGKVVTFSVTAGDGAISPSTDSTDVNGRATSQFTVGSTVGVSTVTATVTEA